MPRRVGDSKARSHETHSTRALLDTLIEAETALTQRERVRAGWLG